MQDGKLTDEVIQSIMREEIPNQKEKPAFKGERITKLILKSIPRGRAGNGFCCQGIEVLQPVGRRIGGDTKSELDGTRGNFIHYWLYLHKYLISGEKDFIETLLAAMGISVYFEIKAYCVE